MCNLVADGALHEHEVELVLLVIDCVLLASLSADEAHGCVGQDGLRGREHYQDSWVKCNTTDFQAEQRH